MTHRDESSDDRGRCDGCGQPFAREELTIGEANTRWCAICVSTAEGFAPPAIAPEHRAHPAYDRVEEDDGEP